MNNLKTKKVGEFVAEDYRTAAVFQRNGIDFCCKGGRTIEEACSTGKISPDTLLADLNDVLKQSGEPDNDFQLVKLDELANYIVDKHHRYIEATTPALRQFLDKLCKVHGSRHPELFEINELFSRSAGELAAHMKKEELMLFPYISRMAQANERGEAPEPSPFGKVENPIMMMMHEHESEGNIFEKISELSAGYEAPADGCTTYRVAYTMLKEFEADLHRHIHLENNILFPKAIAMERELVS